VGKYKSATFDIGEPAGGFGVHGKRKRYDRLYGNYRYNEVSTNREEVSWLTKHTLK
jgi:hypothetical protein